MTDDEAIWHARPAEELYDLAKDADEQCSVAEDADYAQVRNELNQRLTDWMHATGDPLLNGPVPRPQS